MKKKLTIMHKLYNCQKKNEINGKVTAISNKILMQHLTIEDSTLCTWREIF